MKKEWTMESENTKINYERIMESPEKLYKHNVHSEKLRIICRLLMYLILHKVKWKYKKSAIEI